MVSTLQPYAICGAASSKLIEITSFLARRTTNLCQYSWQIKEI